MFGTYFVLKRMDRTSGLSSQPSPNYDTITVSKDQVRNNGYGRSKGEKGTLGTSKSATQTEKSLKGYWTEGDPSKRDSSSGQPDRLLLSALNYWEAKRDLIE